VDEAEGHVSAGTAFVDDVSFVEYAPTALLLAARARVEARHGRGARAREDLVLAQRLRPQLTTALSWFAVQTRLELARVHLALADPAGARALHLEAREVLRRRPALGCLGAESEELGRQIAAAGDPASGWASTLTAAELRLLPLLTTHLSFREIAERLFVSRNTVKTQAISVYRKLDASSRSEAIARAVELGLVDGGVSSPRGDFTPAG
jgi:LuxR family maltose regulon positive regulatory protein